MGSDSRSASRILANMSSLIAPQYGAFGADGDGGGLDVDETTCRRRSCTAWSAVLSAPSISNSAMRPSHMDYSRPRCLISFK